MKTLAQYLAEYIEEEWVKADCPEMNDIPVIAKWLKEGMDAYMSTENCEIIISPNHKENETFVCESCSRVKVDVSWREETEQYECQECYQVWRMEQGLD